jgi:FliI/YscN family ATPase
VTLPEHLQAGLQRALAHNRPRVAGRVRSLVGVAVECSGMRGAVGELCTIHTERGDLDGEIVGFRQDRAIVMPLGEPRGMAPMDTVECHGRPLSVRVSDDLLGRVIDGLGRPLDGGGPLTGAPRPVTSDAPPALSRTGIDRPIETGVAAIDGFLTCGRGQRIGIFAGSGVGKSTLLGMIARGGAADVNVIALCGERGREVNEFLDDVLGPAGRRKSVVVVATSDAAPMVRYKAPFTAVAVAEWFRERGQNVLFMMDSVTRFAAAAREIGLAAGEPPTLRGYPPSLFAQLPRLIERLGNDAHGSITGLLTVLVDGDDLNEPVSDALRGYLDGHIVLSRTIAARGKLPAIDVVSSVSRSMIRVAGSEHRQRATSLRELLAHYEANRDLVQVGAYRRGADPLLDRAMARMPSLERLLYQGVETRPFADTLARMAAVLEDST